MEETAKSLEAASLFFLLSLLALYFETGIVYLFGTVFGLAWYEAYRQQLAQNE